MPLAGYQPVQRNAQSSLVREFATGFQQGVAAYTGGSAAGAQRTNAENGTQSVANQTAQVPSMIEARQSGIAVDQAQLASIKLDTQFAEATLGKRIEATNALYDRQMASYVAGSVNSEANLANTTFDAYNALSGGTGWTGAAESPLPVMHGGPDNGVTNYLVPPR